MPAVIGPNGTATARYIATTRQRHLPPEVLDQAKMCLVDWMGVALGACDEGAAVTVRRLVESWQAHGEAQILLEVAPHRHWRRHHPDAPPAGPGGAGRQHPVTALELGAAAHAGVCHRYGALP